MPGVEELLEKWRQQIAVLRDRMTAIEAIEAGVAPECAEISTAQLCEEFSSWADEVTIWLYQLWDDLYGGDPGTVDPPPKPPFKG